MIQFASEVLEIDLLPWQRWLLIHMLELLPDGSLRFRYVVVLVARQNGKSTLSQILALWFMYVYGVPLVLGTAQDLDTAEEVWQGAVDLVQELDELDNPMRPDLLDLLDRVVMVNGKKSLVLKSGERYKVKAANRRAGRGLSGDLILLDELREHQSWDAWGAITKTTMARAMALILALSNAGDGTSIVLRYLRKLGHAAVGDPDGINANDDPSELLPEDNEADEFELDEDDDSLAVFEWSAEPGCDIRDRSGWAQANPALGYTITERAIASAMRTDPEWVFRTEVLCQWTDGSLEGPFPPGSWERCADPESRVAEGSPIGVCVDVSWDRSTSHIAIAGRREDGQVHVEVVASRPGTDWVAGWFADPARSEVIRSAPVTAQSSGAPVSSLLDELRAVNLGDEERQLHLDVVDWRGTDLGGATGAFYDLVRREAIRHLAQPVLNVAAATAVTRPLGDSYVWDRKHSPADASPLVAATGAVWLIGPKPEEPKKNPKVHDWPEELMEEAMAWAR